MFFFKQKTAYEMRISDWSSDVCSSDLIGDFFNARRSHLRDMHQTVARAEEVDESAEVHSLDDRAFIDRADFRLGNNAADPFQCRADRLPIRGRHFRSEARSVGKECVSACRTRWLAAH